MNGFIPADTDTFTVFNAASLLGFFDNAGNGGRLETSDGSGSFQVNYGVASAFNPNQVVLSDFQIATDADLNNDNDVDGDDFLAIQRTNPALIPLWQSEFGSGLGAASSSLFAESGTTPVPEPTVHALLVTLCLGLLANRRLEQHKKT